MDWREACNLSCLLRLCQSCRPESCRTQSDLILKGYPNYALPMDGVHASRPSDPASHLELLHPEGLRIGQRFVKGEQHIRMNER